ncbi:MAG: hypothetical protein ABEJ72_07590 [Candidatus Aenigmatarchaeota archaeon]
MALVDPVLAARLTSFLGLTNILGVVLIILSCRCIAGGRIYARLKDYELYMKFYKRHCYYWYFFIGSVLLHTAFAFVAYGL